MNIETGKIYRTVEEVADAMERGEELVKLTPAQQKLLGIGASRRRRQARRSARAQRDLAKLVKLSI